MNLKTFPEICPSCSGTGITDEIHIPDDYDTYSKYEKYYKSLKTKKVNCPACEGSGLVTKHISYKPYTAGLDKDE